VPAALAAPGKDGQRRATVPEDILRMLTDEHLAVLDEIGLGAG
jgi:hypothetical protein